MVGRHTVRQGNLGDKTELSELDALSDGVRIERFKDTNQPLLCFHGGVMAAEFRND